MARITVEDCLQKIPNRFQLVLAATYRARMLSQGHGVPCEVRCETRSGQIERLEDSRAISALSRVF